jgi:hypothetical protein
MSTAELRKKLIEKINSTNDNQLLIDATRLLEIQLSEIQEPYELTQEMNSAIHESLQQFKEGEFIEHSKANSEIDKWIE